MGSCPVLQWTNISLCVHSGCLDKSHQMSSNNCQTGSRASGKLHIFLPRILMIKVKLDGRLFTENKDSKKLPPCRNELLCPRQLTSGFVCNLATKLLLTLILNKLVSTYDKFTSRYHSNTIQMRGTILGFRWFVFLYGLTTNVAVSSPLK